MTFRPSNERGRGRTDYHAGRILIRHRPPGYVVLSKLFWRSRRSFNTT